MTKQQDPPKKKPMTPDRLQRAAYHYLERYTTSTSGFHRVMEHKIRRTNENFSPLSSEQQGWIDALTAKCLRLGLLNDTLYAEQKARTLFLQGKPTRHIRRWLSMRGVNATIIARALQTLTDDHGDSHTIDMKAALRFAQRRRFGPWRRSAGDKKKRDREIAAFMRAGFGWQQAVAILDAENTDAALALADEESRPHIMADWPDD